MQRARIMVLLGVLALLAAACGTATPEGLGEAGAGGSARTPLPGAGEPPREPMIAFHTDRDGNYEIYVMGADGSNPTNLTNHRSNDSNPSWSPDGRWIAFQTDRNGHQDIYVMAAPAGPGTAERAEPVRVTYHRADDRRPAWSPDGARFAFNSTRDGISGVYVMDLDGSGVVRLTDDKASNEGAAWAPAGDRIAYSAEDAHYRSALVAVAPDGSRSQGLTPGAGYHDFDPAYAPDGSRIAFASEKPGHLQFEIFVMPADSGWETGYQDAVQLTDLDGMSWRPAWSPDGRQIAFAAKAGNAWGIYLMGADGSGVRALIQGPDRYDAPSWSPVGGAPGG